MRKELSLPEAYQVPWLELITYPSPSLPWLEKAISENKELKPGQKYPDPVLDLREHLIN
jgi:hypothetical protein